MQGNISCSISKANCSAPVLRRTPRSKKKPSAKVKRSSQVRILIAEDDHVSSCMLKSTFTKWGYTDVIVANDGDEALHRLLDHDGPCLAILDWMK